MSVWAHHSSYAPSSTISRYLVYDSDYCPRVRLCEDILWYELIKSQHVRFEGLEAYAILFPVSKPRIDQSLSVSRGNWIPAVTIVSFNMVHTHVFIDQRCFVQCIVSLLELGMSPQLTPHRLLTVIPLRVVCSIGKRALIMPSRSGSHCSTVITVKA